jgi:hypothetical protein
VTLPWSAGCATSRKISQDEGNQHVPPVAATDLLPAEVPYDPAGRSKTRRWRRYNPSSLPDTFELEVNALVEPSSSHLLHTRLKDEVEPFPKRQEE